MYKVSSERRANLTPRSASARYVFFAGFARTLGLVHIWSDYETVSNLSLSWVDGSCVSLGLHREVASVQGRATDVYQSELRKRIFWTW
jgi:hypothetical protein